MKNPIGCQFQVGLLGIPVCNTQNEYPRYERTEKSPIDLQMNRYHFARKNTQNHSRITNSLTANEFMALYCLCILTALNGSTPFFFAIFEIKNHKFCYTSNK